MWWYYLHIDIYKFWVCYVMVGCLHRICFSKDLTYTQDQQAKECKICSWFLSMANKLVWEMNKINLGMAQWIPKEVGVEKMAWLFTPYWRKFLNLLSLFNLPKNSRQLSVREPLFLVNLSIPLFAKFAKENFQLELLKFLRKIPLDQAMWETLLSPKPIRQLVARYTQRSCAKK